MVMATLRAFSLFDMAPLVTPNFRAISETPFPSLTKRSNSRFETTFVLIIQLLGNIGNQFPTLVPLISGYVLFLEKSIFLFKVNDLFKNAGSPVKFHP